MYACAVTLQHNNRLGAGLTWPGWFSSEEPAPKPCVMKMMMKIKRRDIFEQAQLLLTIRTNALRYFARVWQRKGAQI